MTATEELRRLLDERGQHYRACDGVHPITVWHDGLFSYEYTERTLLDGVKPYTGEVVDGTGRLEAVIHVCSPAQAIEATLGRGTCRNIHESPKDTTFWPSPHFKCSECGAVHVSMDYVFYCPRCGREVVE